MMETAEAVLLEFGGIAVSKSGPGVRNARGGVVMDPMLADGEEDRFLAFSTFTSWPTFPLGEVYGGYAFLGVNREGVVFMIGDSLYKLGDDIYEALDVVLEGRRYPIIAEDGQW
jgi:hypothetical protein